jgi:IMP dehydrogenase
MGIIKEETMPKIIKEPSRTFNEYLLIPRYSSSKHRAENVSLKTPLVKYKKGTKPSLSLNIPLTSAIMQSVSDDKMAIALAREGGLSFIFGSQTIEDQAAMVAKVKAYKAGFVPSNTNIRPDQTLAELLELCQQTGHTTTAVTADGTRNGKLLGIVTSRDYRPGVTPPETLVSQIMTPRQKLIAAPDGITLDEANDTIWINKLNTLPIIDKQDRLKFFVFRRDYDTYIDHPDGLLDSGKRYAVGAGINTRDYEARIPALVAAGVDVLCIDSSEGFTEWQERVIKFVRRKYGDKVKIGAGNVVDGDGFKFLAEAGADFVKIGIGGGSICITRKQKGIGRGQASAVLDVAEARNQYFKDTGIYVPICSDGGVAHDYHMTLALAMGADFLMLGRYFARFEESPTNKLLVGGKYVKEYWGEGSARARNWQRYDHGGAAKLAFEEGVDSYVPYAGGLHDNVTLSLEKIKSTMTNCGVLTIPEFHRSAKLTLISPASIVEGGAHDVIQKD